MTSLLRMKVKEIYSTIDIIIIIMVVATSTIGTNIIGDLSFIGWMNIDSEVAQYKFTSQLRLLRSH